MRKQLLALTAATLMSLTVPFTSFAGTWQQDGTGWWFQNNDGTYIKSDWQWIDNNGDGYFEYYYFDKNGYLVTNTEVEGKMVDSNGAWVIDGQVYSLPMDPFVENLQISTNIIKQEYVDCLGKDRNYVINRLGTNYTADVYGTGLEYILNDGTYIDVMFNYYDGPVVGIDISDWGLFNGNQRYTKEELDSTFQLVDGYNYLWEVNQSPEVTVSPSSEWDGFFSISLGDGFSRY